MFLQLNPAQQKAADSINGDYVVIAGPGSGKTAMLIQRYLGMVSKYGILQKDILNLTFTNAAATEMVERVGLLGANEVFRTFHSWALDFAKRERAHFPFKLIDTILPFRGESFELMKSLLRVYPAISSYRALNDKLSEWKRSGVDPEQAIEQSWDTPSEYFLALAYKDYERRSREEGWLDFDSLMRETVNLLENNQDVRNRNRKKYIAVDECQDTDVVQFRLLQLLYGGNIFVVGDENQLIYEWRSAQSGNLSNFSRTFPGAATLYLGRNYRSTGKLVAFFKSILPVDNGLASHMDTERPEGVEPTFTKYAFEMEEVEVTLSSIQRLYEIGDVAIIARTNRQLQTYQKACMRTNVQSRILGKKNVWEENEVKHLLELAREYRNQEAPAAKTMSDLIEEHNLTYKYRNTGNPNEKDPVENLNDIVRMAGKRGNLKEFLTWLRKLTFGSKSKKSQKPMLTLTTVHQAKGREWKHVFVVGCNQGLMPHKDGELLEEHRIFFVACSRAADTLNISFYGNRSQFLNDFVDKVVLYEQKQMSTMSL